MNTNKIIEKTIDKIDFSKLDEKGIIQLYEGLKGVQSQIEADAIIHNFPIVHKQKQRKY